MACREETEEIPNLAQEESAEEIKSVVILQEEEQGEADDNYKTEFPSPGTENNYDDQEFVQLDAEDETAQQNPRRPQDSSNPYRNSRTRTIHEVGRTAITFGQAKLFGLVDVSGNLTLEKLVGSSGGNKDFQRKHIELLAKKPATKPTEDADALGEFKPLKSEQALRAMRNPRCGYDFVSRLNERGDPLEALTSAPPAAKKDLEAEKELYAFRQDKLSCPSCKRTQSFDEFVEKRRQCSQCQQKYVKVLYLVVTSCSSVLVTLVISSTCATCSASSGGSRRRRRGGRRTWRGSRRRCTASSPSRPSLCGGRARDLRRTERPRPLLRPTRGYPRRLRECPHLLSPGLLSSRG